MSRAQRSMDTAQAMNSRRARGLARRVAPLLGVGGLLASCGALVGDRATVGGETHFLVSCEGGCGPGLSCFDGVCTRACEPGDGSCSSLGAGAVCVSVPLEDDTFDEPQFTGTCDVTCVEDADCAALGGAHACLDGACRAAAPSARAPETGSAGQPLVSAVDVETCEEQLRWVGGDEASSEMLPGSDCVGCHDDTGARRLLLGGTVYSGLADPSAPPQRNCFGAEGVRVTITDAIGHRYTTYTNRAGNFYFEAPEGALVTPYPPPDGTRSALVTPYTARVELGDGSPQMAAAVSYGGCARCHGAERNPNPFNIIVDDPSYVISQPEIWTP